MWWGYNCNLYLCQFMCSIKYNLPGYIYSGVTANCIIKLSCKYNYLSLLNTIAGQYCFQCMVSDCIGNGWMQWCAIE